MPRDPCEDNMIRSGLFALESSLYGLEYGESSHADKDEDDNGAL